MASGLFALLDDVAAIAKVAATSLDDVGAAAGKAGAKAVGVVVDDTAVTPGYAIGFTPDRELPIVAKIALGSLRNKFLFLLPGALVLTVFAPWAVTPILMMGGAYLSFEAAEKILGLFGGHEEESLEPSEPLSPGELEREKVSGAIRTDLILSAEIMAISLATVADRTFLIQAAALGVVGLLLTFGVYGVVALIVKMDDIGLHMARRREAGWSHRLGFGLVRAMPVVMQGLTVVGTIAMLWVGGGILVHGLEGFGIGGPALLGHTAAASVASAPVIGPAAAWIAATLVSAAAGLLTGLLVAMVVHVLGALRRGLGRKAL